MKSHKEVDHRRNAPETVFELKKAALRLRRQARQVKEIVEVTGLAGVRALILREYGIKMPIRTVGEYLKRWGFTVQRPSKQAMKQNPEAVEQWLKQEYPVIHARAKREGAEIFWGDETAVQNVEHYARGCAPRGQTPVLRIQARKMHIHMISAISASGKVHFPLYSEGIDADRLIGFMGKV